MILTPKHIHDLYIEGRPTPPEPVHHWKLNEDAEGLVHYHPLRSNNAKVGSSTIGSTPTFSSCKFGRGFNATNSSIFIASTPLSEDIVPRGTFEVWLKMNVASSSMPSWSYLAEESSAGWGTNRFALIFEASNFWTIQRGNSVEMINESDTEYFTYSHAAGEILHYAYVWDDSGIDGSTQTHRIYINGKLYRASSVAVPSGTAVEGLRLGSRTDNIQSLNAVMDNLKVWNYAKTDFSDRFTEAPSYLGAVDSGTSPVIGNRKSASVGETGILGQTSYGFDGNSQGLIVPHRPEFDVNGKTFTYTVWIRFDDVTGGARILGHVVDGVWTGYYWGAAVDLSLDFITNNNSTVMNGTNGEITLGQWYHLALKYDGAKAYTYINGKVTDTYVGSIQDPTVAGQELHIGWLHTGAPQYHNGAIQDFRMYDVSLTDKQIQDIMTKGYIE